MCVWAMLCPPHAHNTHFQRRRQRPEKLFRRSLLSIITFRGCCESPKTRISTETSSSHTHILGKICIHTTHSHKSAHTHITKMYPTQQQSKRQTMQNTRKFTINRRSSFPQNWSECVCVECVDDDHSWTRAQLKCVREKCVSCV